MRVNELVAAAERLLQRLAARVRARLVVADLPVSQKPADVRVVLSELPDGFFLFRQMIDPAVADVAKIHPARHEPAQAQRRLHSGGLFITPADKNKRAMNPVEQFCQHVGKSGLQSERGM